MASKLTKEVLADGVELWLGDCLEIMPALEGRFSLVVTSPPYNIGAAPWARLGHWRPGVASGSGGRSKWKKGAEGGAGVAYGTHGSSQHSGAHCPGEGGQGLSREDDPLVCLFRGRTATTRKFVSRIKDRSPHLAPKRTIDPIEGFGVVPAPWGRA